MVSTKVEQIDRRYAAATIHAVWDEIHGSINLDEEELIAIIEEHPAITIVRG